MIHIRIHGHRIAVFMGHEAWFLDFSKYFTGVNPLQGSQGQEAPAL